MAKEFSRQHEVVYYECDVNGHMTIPTMIRLAIHVSESQSEELNRGADFVHQFGVTWILTNYHIRLTELPRVCEQITITTKAEEYNKYFCYRTFWIRNEADEELVKIQAVFALMKIETRKLSRVTEEIIAPFESQKITKIKRFGQLEKIEAGESLPYRVRFNDIDSNHHVNNAVYFDWLLDVLGYDFLTTYVPKTITIRYDREVEYGNEIASVVEKVYGKADQLHTRHAILLDDQMCCEALIEWGKLSE